MAEASASEVSVSSTQGPGEWPGVPGDDVFAEDDLRQLGIVEARASWASASGLVLVVGGILGLLADALGFVVSPVGIHIFGTGGSVAAVLAQFAVVGVGVLGIHAGRMQRESWAKYYHYGIIASAVLYVGYHVAFVVLALGNRDANYQRFTHYCHKFSRDSSFCDGDRSVVTLMLTLGGAVLLLCSVAYCACCFCISKSYKDAFDTERMQLQASGSIASVDPSLLGSRSFVRSYGSVARDLEHGPRY